MSACRTHLQRSSAPWLIIGCIWTAPVAAQSSGDEAAQPTQLEEVNVTGRREFDDRFMSTASRVTVTRRDIEAMGANSIGDILRQTPGLQVSTTANGGLEIRMRGMGTESTRIQVDGVAVSSTNRSAQLPLDELPADLIERVEVIRAPTADQQGTAGGTLNIVLRGASPKKETFMWITDQMVWGRHAPSLFVSQTGPLGTSAAPPALKPADAAATANHASWSYFVSLNLGERNLGSDSRRETSTNTAAPTLSNIRDESRLLNRFWTLTPRATGRLGASDRVTLRGVLSGLDQDGRVHSNSSGLSSGATLTGSAQSPWTFDRSFYQGAIDWSHSFPDSKWDTTVQLERSRNDYRADRNSSSTLAGVTTTQASLYNEDRAERGLLAKTKLDMATGAAASSIVSMWSVGGELELRKLDVDSASITAGARTPLSFDATTRRQALWTQFEMPAETIKTALTFGLRAQDFATDVVAAGAPGRYRRLTWQPSLNARTALTENTQVRVNLARISRNPRVWELAPVNQPNLSTNSPNAPDFQGNSNLRPETTVTLDTGLDRRLAIGGQAGVNLFVRQQSNVIRRRLTLIGTRWSEQPDNIGDALIWGVETDIRTNLAWAGLGRDWTLAANASLLNSRFRNGTSSGQRIPGQARYLANLTIAKPLRASGGWYGGGTLALVGASDLNTASASGVTVSGGQRAHAQLDLFIGSALPGLGFWRLNWHNLTDFHQDRNRVVANALNGTVNTEHSDRTQTPRWLLTLGTRF